MGAARHAAKSSVKVLVIGTRKVTVPSVWVMLDWQYFSGPHYQFGNPGFRSGYQITAKCQTIQVDQSYIRITSDKQAGHLLCVAPAFQA